MSAPLDDMPVLAAALDRLGPVDGLPIALALPMDASVARLAEWLRDAGAKVGMIGQANTSAPEAQGDLDTCPPSYIIGAPPGDVSRHRGVVTDRARFAQNVPVVDLSQSPLLTHAQGHIGVGQASVMALVDITNLQLAGRVVVVCGFGPTGEGVAAHVAALGGRVSIVESDPVRAVRALGQGHSVHRFAQCLPRAEVVFATDDGPPLQIGDANHLIGKTLLCAAGSQAQVSPEIIALGGDLRPVRAHVSAFDLPHARDLKLIAEGRPLHLAEGFGLPLEAADIVLALHISGLSQLLRRSSDAPLVAPLAPEAEAALAAVRLCQVGAELQP